MKNKFKKGNNRLPPFVPLTWDMLNHPAYKKLPPSAAKALPYFLGKVKMSYGDPRRCESDFDFTYPEARRYGFTDSTFKGVLDDLVKFGFIDVTYKGGLRGNGKSKNLFSLSERWKKYGSEDFEQLDRKTILPRKHVSNAKM